MAAGNRQLAAAFVCMLCACGHNSRKESNMATPILTIVRVPIEGEMPPIEHATAWLNSSPLTPADLRGKVVLVNFWTYTCINWRRTLPYLRTWANRYRDQGLVVIGVHTPEFSFEEKTENVRRAVLEQSIQYPI